jgi:ABC-type transporter Mla subunit MlaD
MDPSDVRYVMALTQREAATRELAQRRDTLTASMRRLGDIARTMRATYNDLGGTVDGVAGELDQASDYLSRAIASVEAALLRSSILPIVGT